MELTSVPSRSKMTALKFMFYTFYEVNEVYIGQVYHHQTQWVCLIFKEHDMVGIGMRLRKFKIMAADNLESGFVIEINGPVIFLPDK